jgi:hypothetical protein
MMKSDGNPMDMKCKFERRQMGVERMSNKHCTDVR